MIEKSKTVQNNEAGNREFTNEKYIKEMKVKEG